MNKNNKVIIIGAGLAGSVMARLFAEENYKVEIYELNNHIAGNLYDEYNESGILIHKYGPHIFHTNNQEVWDFVNRFTTFESYINQVLVDVNNKLIQLPINLNSIKELFNQEFDEFYQDLIKHFSLNTNVSILELKQKLTNNTSKKIVDYIFDNVYKNYTMKMWGLKIDQLDKNLFSRVKINLDYDWNYFPNDKYQAIPTKGYSELIKNILNHKNISVYLNTNALKYISFKRNEILFKNNKNIVVYTGKLDELFNYKFNRLNYRSLKIIFETYNIDSYQPTAVVNYPSDPLISRITEYKKLTKQIKQGITTISKEIPGEYNPDSIDFNHAFYPINNNENLIIKEKYQNLAKQYKNLILVGRLAEYKYYDMDDVIEQCFYLFNQFIKNL